jgi:hypothetical protein
MAQKKDQSVSSEVKSRLEELFMDDDSPVNSEGFEGSEKPAGDALRELKAVVLSVDWEINDETMSGLMDQIDVLKKDYQQDRICLLFLQLLGKLGIYIKTKKANAHPDSIKLLSSAYQSFEKAVMDKQLSESARKKLLQTEVARFMQLREQISPNMQVAKTQAKAYPKGSETEKIQIPIELTAAIEEIKTMIRSEFNDLKTELRMWIEKRS